MSFSHYQSKYFAYELTKRYPPDSVEKLTGAVASAQVDLNPHQVDAALFAFQSPLSKGALLADEVDRWLTNNDRKSGTLHVSRWGFKMPLRNSERVFVVVTRQDTSWGNVADGVEPYSLVTVLADRENAMVNLYAQVQAQLETRIQVRARARV